MSLIEEALRRLKDPALPPIQTTLEKPRPAQKDQGTVHSWETTRPAEASAPAALPQTTMTVAVALAILILTAALITGGALWLGRALSERSSVATMPSAPRPSVVTALQHDEQVAALTITKAAHPRQPALTAASASPPGSQDAFVLSGVVEGLGKPYAVINGSIVSVGEHIGGAMLLDIGHGSAKLRLADGKEVDLHIPR